MHPIIKNNKGMACQLVAMAYGRDEARYNRRVVYALDIAGAVTAVKAIWASLCSGGPMKVYGIRDAYCTYRGDREAGYRAFVSQPLPGITHYHILPEPKGDGDYFLLTSLTGESEADALYHVLRLYTPQPVLPEWARALFELGSSHKYRLISSLDAVGMEWAYRVEAHGWDALLDEAARAGQIKVPEEHHG